MVDRYSLQNDPEVWEWLKGYSGWGAFFKETRLKPENEDWMDTADEGYSLQNVTEAIKFTFLRRFRET